MISNFCFGETLAKTFKRFTILIFSSFERLSNSAPVRTSSRFSIILASLATAPAITGSSPVSTTIRTPKDSACATTSFVVGFSSSIKEIIPQILILFASSCSVYSLLLFQSAIEMPNVRLPSSP